MRIGPNELVTDDPEVLRKMMAVRSRYTRGPCEEDLAIHNGFYCSLHISGYSAMRFDPTRDNLLSMQDEDAHAKLRGKMAAGVRLDSVSL